MAVKKQRLTSADGKERHLQVKYGASLLEDMCLKQFLPFCSSFLFILCTVCAYLIPSCYFHSIWDILHTSYKNLLFSLCGSKTSFSHMSSFHPFSNPYLTICDLWLEGLSIILCFCLLSFCLVLFVWRNVAAF